MTPDERALLLLVAGKLLEHGPRLGLDSKAANQLAELVHRVTTSPTPAVDETA